MKVKIFRFVVSSNVSQHTDSLSTIEDEINLFLDLSQAEVIDIKTSTVTTTRHNNGGKDTVELIYTILYR